MATFDHERLDVYHVALEWVCTADEMIRSFPSGRAYLADQLQRAATSVVLNIAEGAGEFSKKDKFRFYRMARRSATECAAVVDVCRCLKIANERTLTSARAMLIRIVSMLVRLVNAGKSSGTGTGTGTGTGRTRSV